MHPPNRTRELLTAGPCTPDGVYGPGPGRYCADLDLTEGLPPIQPLAWDLFCDTLAQSERCISDYPVDDFVVKDLRIARKRVHWEDPRAGAFCIRRKEAWAPTHIMVMLGRWRPPYRTRAALNRVDFRKDLRLWYFNSLPALLIRGISRSPSVDAWRNHPSYMFKLYKAFALNTDISLELLQQCYRFRNVLPSLKLVKTPIALFAKGVQDLLRQDMREFIDLEDHLPQAPLSAAGNLYLRSRNSAPMTWAALRYYTRQHMRQYPGAAVYSVMLKAFMTRWNVDRTTGRAKTMQKLIEILGLYLLVPGPKRFELSALMAPYLLSVDASVLQDDKALSVLYYCRSNLRDSALHKWMEMLQDQHMFALAQAKLELSI